MSQAINQVIPEGYKQTEVGVIPEDWNYSELGDFVSSLEAGISVNSVDKIDAFSHGLHILKTSCVSKGYFYPNEIKSVIPSDVHKAKTIPSDGSIIVSRMNTPDLVGELGFVDGNYPNLFLPDRLWQMRFRSNVKTNNRWLAYILTFPATSKKIKESATGTSNSMKNISKGSLLSVSFPSPAYEEQTAIANALSDMDALLSELENLIAKKQAIKTATMQQLLTGKTRLPQFAFYSDINSPEGAVEGKRKHSSATNANVSPCDDGSLASQESRGMVSRRKSTKASELGEIPEDWEVVRFGNIVNYIKGYPFKSGEYTDSGLRVVRVSDTSFTTIKNDNPIFVSLKSKNKYKKWSLEEGNIIFTTVGSKPPMYDSLVGKAILVEPQHSGYLLNQNAVLIKPKLKAKNISNLLISHFRTERYIDHIEQIYRGNANQASITLDGLFEFEIPLPTEPEEQTAIASILSDMDNEIQTLEQRLSKTRQIKQGMMQELLTGKNRLPFYKDTTSEVSL